jgi:hypothetical protein
MAGVASTPRTRPSELAREEADLARAGAQVEHGLARAHEPAGVAAAVVALEDLRRQDREEAGLVVDRTAELGDRCAGPPGVARADRCEDVEGDFGSGHRPMGGGERRGRRGSPAFGGPPSP